LIDRVTTRLLLQPYYTAILHSNSNRTSHHEILPSLTVSKQYHAMAARPVEEVLRIEDLAVSQNDSDETAKEDALLKELEGVRNLNRVMEAVITAMTKARHNMDVSCLFSCKKLT
jgi:hypothetical protein